MATKLFGMGKPRSATLTMECSDWAELFGSKNNVAPEKLQFYAFKPNRLRVEGAEFLGRFTDKNFIIFDPVPSWQWHVAVEYNGNLFDEIHNSGVPILQYLNFFEHIEDISVTIHSSVKLALESANNKY
jgi:hypothetical protein